MSSYVFSWRSLDSGGGGTAPEASKKGVLEQLDEVKRGKWCWYDFQGPGLYELGQNYSIEQCRPIVDKKYPSAVPLPPAKTISSYLTATNKPQAKSMSRINPIVLLCGAGLVGYLVLK